MYGGDDGRLDARLSLRGGPAVEEGATRLCRATPRWWVLGEEADDCGCHVRLLALLAEGRRAAPLPRWPPVSPASSSGSASSTASRRSPDSLACAGGLCCCSGRVALPRFPCRSAAGMRLAAASVGGCGAAVATERCSAGDEGAEAKAAPSRRREGAEARKAEEEEEGWAVLMEGKVDLSASSALLARLSSAEEGGRGGEEWDTNVSAPSLLWLRGERRPPPCAAAAAAPLSSAGGTCAHPPSSSPPAPPASS